MNINLQFGSVTHSTTSEMEVKSFVEDILNVTQEALDDLRLNVYFTKVRPLTQFKRAIYECHIQGKTTETRKVLFAKNKDSDFWDCLRGCLQKFKQQADRCNKKTRRDYVIVRSKDSDS